MIDVTPELVEIFVHVIARGDSKMIEIDITTQALKAGLEAVFEALTEEQAEQLHLEKVSADMAQHPPLIGPRPEMLSDRLGYSASVGDEDWQRIREARGL